MERNIDTESLTEEEKLYLERKIAAREEEKKKLKEEIHKPLNFRFEGTLAQRQRATRPRVLCLDGGGMRGVITIEFIKEIEKRAGKRIGDLFDLICGTSTGGLISASAVYKAASGLEAEEMYTTVGNDIFSRNKLSQVSGISADLELYSSNRFQNILKMIVGDAKLDSVRYPYMFVVSTDFTNEERPQTHLFSNYSDEANKVMVWQALRSTAAATVFFRNFILNDRTYQDGGLKANNPTEVALHECWTLWGKDPQLAPASIVSIGTGHFKGKDVKPKVKPGSVSQLLSTTFKEAVAIATDTEDIHERVLRQQERDQAYKNTKYFRLNVDMPKPYGLDVIDPHVLDELKQLAREYIIAHSDEIDAIVASLQQD